MAKALLDIVQKCIRDEERQDCFTEFYRVVHAGIDAYAIQEARMQQRLNPSRN